ncbi:MAG TPA: MBL fold metallo-hydrolase [Acidobacteriaceae bacterium]|nr:MBL fold metallo-hydrolase [Acidobacteriaceae bacterium]
MDKVEIAEDQIVPMEAIAPGLNGLKITFVNVFGVTHADGSWTLIDAALPLSAGRIKSWADRTFGRAPNAIVLTHGHFDHVSAAKELADEWNVPVYAHPLEFPYLTGEKEYPAPDWKAGGGVMPLMSPTLPRGPVDLGTRLKALPGEGANLSLVEMPGWTLLHTPGHTPGHVSFFRESDRTLLVGDAFCTTKPESFFAANFTQPAELHGPPAYFTSDWGAAKASVRKLAALEPKTVAPGHGKPLAGAEVAPGLAKLAADFEQIAVPDDVKAGTPGGETHL